MPAFTLKEAADELRISLRNFQDIVKRHPFYYPNGNRKLFTEENLASIRSALAEEQQSKSITGRPITYASPSGELALAKALALLSAKRKQRTSSKRGAK